MNIVPLICPLCGGAIDPSDNTCKYCGSSMYLEQQASSDTTCFGSWRPCEACAMCMDAQTCYEYTNKPEKDKTPYDRTMEECVKYRRTMGDPYQLEM